MAEQGIPMPDASAISLIQTQIDGRSADMLYIDRAALAAHFAYVGFWYACDKSEETSIIADLYFGERGEPRPADPGEEVLENSFKKSPRLALAAQHGSIWIAARVGADNYCRLKIGTPVAERSFINYKVIKHRGSAYDTLKTGVIRGDGAVFQKIGVEDNAGALDFNDTIFFLVCVKSLPPEDWNFDPALFGVNKLPVVVNPFLLSVKGSYSRWLGQDPLQGVK